MKNYEIKYYEYVEPKTERRVVKAVTFYRGKAIYAFAKCDCQDTFDYEFGMKLATKRLDYKVNQRRYAHAKAYAKFCKQRLEAIKLEKRKIEKLLLSAEVACGNRAVELHEAEVELARFLVED